MRRIGVFLLLAVPMTARDYGRLPLVFEPNQGQADPEVKFLARSRDAALFLTEREAVLVAKGAAPVRMRLAHAGKPKAIHGLEPTGGISNYFLGNDPSKWRTNIPNYRRVEYQSVYAGVDLVYYGNPQKLEYDLIVAPGADVAAIQVEYEGVESLSVDGAGDLVLKTSSGELRQKRPVAYQGSDRVEVRYRLKGRRVAFELARYDAGRRLVIDPVLLYSTYLGGSGIELGYAIAVDGSGNAYVTGQTTSTNFPVTSPLQTNNGGGSSDVFVTKINAAGSARLYSTYLGGTGSDQGNGIAVDGTGAAYLTGSTSSINFPTSNALQSSFGGGGDAFVTKINAAGSALVYSTYLGGSGSDGGNGIAIDSSGAAYVIGQTFSTNFPTTSPYQSTNNGGPINGSAFVTKINTAGSAKAYSTYLGGSGGELGYGIAVDGSGAAYVTGYTYSTNFPTANPIQGTNAGGEDAFVTKFNAAGSALVYSTYLGGSGTDSGRAIAVDGSGAAYLIGSTASTNFPTVSSLQFSGGGVDAFVTKINAAGSALVYSTYLGGSGTDVGNGIAVDGAGNAYVAGFTSSTNFATVNALQSSNGGGIADVFAAKINSTGGTLLFWTYLGGSGDDEGNGIAVDGWGNAYVTGFTASTSFPTASPEQSSSGGGYDAFVAVISGNSPVAAFRNTSGAIELTSELSTALSNAGGVFASDPSVWQNANGDTYVVARDASNAVWLNVFDHQTRLWDGWTSAGGSVQGVPAIAAIGNVAFLIARDQSNAYWENTFIRGLGFGGWNNRGGAFATDPAIGADRTGSNNLYAVGKDNFNAIWTSYLNPAFGTWTLQGAVVNGKPSVTVGADGAAYIGIRDNSNAVWMGQQLDSTFNGWQPGHGSVASDPQVAATGTVVYAAATTAGGGVWYNTFNQGTGNNWQTWTNTGGALASVTAAASTGPQLFLSGVDASGALWWYESPGAGFKLVGDQGLSAGLLSAGPR